MGRRRNSTILLLPSQALRWSAAKEDENRVRIWAGDPKLQEYCTVSIWGHTCTLIIVTAVGIDAILNKML